MENRWNDIFNFISYGVYPDEYNKQQRQNLRRYAAKFEIKNGELYFNHNRKVVKTKGEAREIFEEFHNSSIGGHSGILKTRIALSSRFYWLGMALDTEKWVAACPKCHTVPRPLMLEQRQESAKVTSLWELLGIDLLGPFPETADGFKFILAATDCFSRWVEAFPLKSTSTKEVAKHICSLIYRHGCPQRILCDEGKEFVNEVNNELCQLLGIRRTITAAYLQTNGLDKKFTDNIKRVLKKHVDENQGNWDVFLEATLFCMRSKVHTTTRHSPFALMYGREARFPSEVPTEFPLSTIVMPGTSDYDSFAQEKIGHVEMLHTTAVENMNIAQVKYKEAYLKRMRKKNVCENYSVGDEVMLCNGGKRSRRGLESDFSGPYMLADISGRMVTLKNQQGEFLKDKYNVNLIKPYRRLEGNTLIGGLNQSEPEHPNLKVECATEDIKSPLQLDSVIPKMEQ